MMYCQSVRRSIYVASLVMGVTGIIHAAEPIRLEPLSDEEITANADSGAACWAEIKGKTYLYDDTRNGFVKVNGKVMKLKILSKGDQMGEGPYLSPDGALKIVVLANGNLEIQQQGNKSILKSKHDCGA